LKGLRLGHISTFLNIGGNDKMARFFVGRDVALKARADGQLGIELRNYEENRICQLGL
jgi:hypothetical protein